VERLEELWNWILACSPNLDEESQQRMTDLSTLLCHLAELWRVSDVSKRAALWVAVGNDINTLSKVRFDEEQIKWLLVLMCGLEESSKRCDSTEVLVMQFVFLLDAVCRCVCGGPRSQMNGGSWGNPLSIDTWTAKL
jgi:hypothetical protein